MYTQQLKQTIRQLELNNFEVHLAFDAEEAYGVFKDTILSKLDVKTASYGDSLTLKKTGVLDLLRNDEKITFIETFDKEASREQNIENRRQALHTDLFVTGTNAITEAGQLVNLDMVGNRIGGITFGPKNVVLFVGVNKIVENLDAAFKRIRTIAAPMNMKAHEGLNTPCQKTGECHNCHSEHRICNTWTITEKSYPKKRVKIILIDEKLGY